MKCFSMNSLLSISFQRGCHPFAWLEPPISPPPRPKFIAADELLQIDPRQWLAEESGILSLLKTRKICKIFPKGMNQALVIGQSWPLLGTSCLWMLANWPVCLRSQGLQEKLSRETSRSSSSRERVCASKLENPKPSREEQPTSTMTFIPTVLEELERCLRKVPQTSASDTTIYGMPPARVQHFKEFLMLSAKLCNRYWLGNRFVSILLCK